MRPIMLVKTFDVETFYDDQALDEIETNTEMNDILPPLCFPKFVVETFTNLPIIQAEDHGNYILWKEDGQPINMIQLLDEGDELEDRSELKSLMLVQAADFIEPLDYRVAETGAFYTVFQDMKQWILAAYFLNNYCIALRDYVRARFRVNENAADAERQIKQVDQTLWMRRTNAVREAFRAAEQQLSVKLGTFEIEDPGQQFSDYCGTFDDLCRFLAETAVEYKHLPEYLDGTDPR